jgi:hypothetical protein
MLGMAKKVVAIDRREVISLSDLASRFAKAKGMDTLGNWIRLDRSGEFESGNSLAALKALRSFNEVNPLPIAVFKVAGYDGTKKPTLVISKGDVIRLKGYLLRGAKERKGRSPKVVEFRVLEEVKV